MSEYRYKDGYIFDSGVQLIKRLYADKNGQYTCQFKCPKCGNIFETALYNVTSGDTKSCGCLKTGISENRGSHLVGQRFGKLLVLSRTDKRNNAGYIMYKCKCDCGNTCYVPSLYLTHGITRSCGCLRKDRKGYEPKNKKDLRGQKFGKLTVIEDSGLRNSNGSIMWRCKCECGNYHNVSTTDLVAERNISCGCVISRYERLLEKILNDNNIYYIKQKSFDNCINPKTGYKLRFDFYLPDYNCCIEYDGAQHFKSIKYFGGENKLKRQQELDAIKNEYCKDNNIHLLRITYKDNNKINDEYIMNLLDSLF